MFNSLKEFFSKNPSYRFVAVFLVTYLVLNYFTIFYMGITSPGNYYSSFLDEHLNYIRGFRTLLIDITSGILQLLGYTVTTSDTMLHAYNIGGFNIVYSCLGFGVMSFFVAFVVAYPKSLKSKLIFIPTGLLFIQLLNITRLLMITLYWRKSLLFGKIDHHTLFNIILYTILLIIIYIWVNSKDQESEKTKQVEAG